MRARRAWVALLLVLPVSACDDDHRSTPPAPVALVLGACGDRIDLAAAALPEARVDRLSFTCGVLEVPLDHDDPTGEQIPMAVVRIRDTDQHDRIGSLVMNPGGPGQSGLSHAASWAGWLPDEILERFDVVTFDPRGTGLSDGINCGSMPEDEQPARLLDLTTSDGFAEAERLARAQTAACAARVGADRLRSSTPPRRHGTWTCSGRHSGTSS